MLLRAAVMIVRIMLSNFRQEFYDIGTRLERALVVILVPALEQRLCLFRLADDGRFP